MNIKLSVGIDISKNDFHVCLCSIDAQQRIKVIRSGKHANNKSGFTSLVLWLKTQCSKAGDLPLVVTMEATGVYYENCAMFLYKAGFNLSVVLPDKSKKYIASLGIKTKNDKVDAQALSRMGAERDLELWQPVGDFFYTLRSLTRHHQSLTEMLTVLGNQLEAAQHSMYENKDIIKSLEKMMKLVDKQIADNSKTITAHIKSDEMIAQKVKNLTAIKGVAMLTAATILAETNGFELFKNSAQLVSYAGYDVVEDQSGTRSGKTKISKRGNGRIRRALHMPALSAVTHHVKIFRDLYERTYQKHGIKMKSYVAVQKNCWLSCLHFGKRMKPLMPAMAIQPKMGKRCIPLGIAT